MKICFVNTRRLWAGGERWFLWAAGAMSHRGHDVFVVVTYGSELGRRAATSGLWVETAGRILTFKLRRVFCDLAPDIVLCNTPGEARAAVVAGLSYPETRMVLRRGLCRDLGRGMIKRWLLGRLDGIICNSDETTQLLKRSHRWLAGRNLTVMHNPVPPLEVPSSEEIDDRRERLGIGKEDLVILSVGRLDPDKGHAILAEAFSEVVRVVPAAKLVVAGEGPERRKMETIAGNLEVMSYVRLCGFVENVSPLYALADILVQPSLPGYESFSNSALEAMSFGLPVVATTCGGFPELIADGKNGLLVPPGDVEKTAGAIIRLAKDETLRKRLGESGRETVLRHFDRDRKAEELETCLSGIVNVI